MYVCLKVVFGGIVGFVWSGISPLVNMVFLGGGVLDKG
jgi:hypothetical protein